MWLTEYVHKWGDPVYNNQNQFMLMNWIERRQFALPLQPSTYNLKICSRWFSKLPNHFKSIKATRGRRGAESSFSCNSRMHSLCRNNKVCVKCRHKQCYSYSKHNKKKRASEAHYWSCNFSYIKDGYFNHAASVTELLPGYKLRLKLSVAWENVIPQGQKKAEQALKIL